MLGLCLVGWAWLVVQWWVLCELQPACCAIDERGVCFVPLCWRIRPSLPSVWLSKMEVFKSLIQVVNVLSAVVVIVLVLLQHGKGADMGAAFGSGSSGSLFGASGSANFLSRTTAISATIFFCSLFALVWVDSKPGANAGAGVMSGVVQTQPASGQEKTPAKPVQNDNQSSIPN